MAGSCLRDVQPASGATITFPRPWTPLGAAGCVVGIIPPPLAKATCCSPHQRLRGLGLTRWSGGGGVTGLVSSWPRYPVLGSSRRIACRDARDKAARVVDVCTECRRCPWRLGRSNSMGPRPCCAAYSLRRTPAQCQSELRVVQKPSRLTRIGAPTPSPARPNTYVTWPKRQPNR